MRFPDEKMLSITEAKSSKEENREIPKIISSIAFETSYYNHEFFPRNMSKAII